MDDSNLATIMVVVLASLVLIQSFVIAVVVVLLTRRVSLLDRQVTGYFGRVRKGLEGAEKVLDQALSIQKELPVWEQRIAEAIEVITRNSSEIDGYAAKAVKAARAKVEAGGRTSDQLLDEFSRTGYRVHQAVRDPSHRISAAVSALQAAVGQIFGRRDTKEPGNHPPEKQIFI